MVSNKLKIFWQNQGLLHVPWQLHRASAVTLLHPSEFLQASRAHGLVAVEKNLKTILGLVWGFFLVSFFDSLFIPKIQMSCGGGDRLHVSSYLSSTVPGATVQRG